MNETDVQLATRYATKQWQKQFPNHTPPLELTEAIVKSVMALGYTHNLVDKLITSFIENDIRKR